MIKDTLAAGAAQIESAKYDAEKSFNKAKKKAAKAAGEKKIEMAPVKDILSLTGYIRGGCSPVGMKKPFPTFVSAEAEQLPDMIVSAGKIGMQLKLAPADLLAVTKGQFADVTV